MEIELLYGGDIISLWDEESGEYSPYTVCINPMGILLDKYIFVETTIESTINADSKKGSYTCLISCTDGFLDFTIAYSKEEINLLKQDGYEVFFTCMGSEYRKWSAGRIIPELHKVDEDRFRQIVMNRGK
jgi:hypothetical protein